MKYSVVYLPKKNATVRTLHNRPYVHLYPTAKSARDAVAKHPTEHPFKALYFGTKVPELQGIQPQPVPLEKGRGAA